MSRIVQGRVVTEILSETFSHRDAEETMDLLTTALMMQVDLYLSDLRIGRAPVYKIVRVDRMGWN